MCHAHRDQPYPMIRLQTLGQISVHIGNTPLKGTNTRLIEAILFVVDEAREIPRREFADLFFPNSASGLHSARQLLSRLRNLGVDVTTGSGPIVLKNDVKWDVDTLLAR